MHFSATNISQDLSRYLLNKASKRYYYQNAKKEAMMQFTKEEAHNFSQQCSKTVLNLYNLRSNTQIPTLGNEDTLLSPTCHQKKQQFQYTPACTLPADNGPVTTKTLASKRAGRLTLKISKPKQVSHCLPLKLAEDKDEFIEVLRQRKQKMFNLQNFFKQTEQSEKIKYKFEKPSKKQFTTDYNGDKIEFKRLSRPANNDSYFAVEVNTKIREEREENQRFNIELNSSNVKIDNCAKENIKNMRRTAPLNYKYESKMTLTQTSHRKVTRESVKLDHLTLREMERDFSIQTKSQKSQLKSQKSKFQKYKHHAFNISSIDFIKPF